MRAMRLERAGEPLRPADLPRPAAAGNDVLLRVRACGVCRTDLHIVDGELPLPVLPIVPGHQVVGTVVAAGPAAEGLAAGTRVGVPWLGWTCGECRFCRRGDENLCDHARFTGLHRDGGFAEYALADARYCFPLPESYADTEAAPLLCAGLIGYRALRLAGPARRLGFYGFGAAAHILIQVAARRGQEVFAFTRPEDTEGQAFARSLGAAWAGGAGDRPPEPLEAAIVFAPVGALVPAALAAVDKGGVVVCAGIHMSDIPAFPYRLLWEERSIRSVANLTRRDGEEFLAAIREAPVRTEVTVFRLEEANEALRRLREGRLQGAAVVQVAME